MPTPYPFSLRGLVAFIRAQQDDKVIFPVSGDVPVWSRGIMKDFIDSSTAANTLDWVDSFSPVMKVTVMSSVYHSYATILVCEELCLFEWDASEDELVFDIWDRAHETGHILLMPVLYDLALLGDLVDYPDDVKTYGDLWKLMDTIPHLSRIGK